MSEPAEKQEIYTTQADISRPLKVVSEFQPAGDQLTDFISEQRELRKSSPRRKPGPIHWIPDQVRDACGGKR